MNKIAVIHYMPVEYYPPTTNFLDIASVKQELKIQVWTTYNTKKRTEYLNHKLFKISRSAMPLPSENAFLRLVKYFVFNLKTLIGLLFFKPDKVFYYESYSAWPVFWYLKLARKKTKLYIHYHEYFAQEWYENGMKLVKKYHQYEVDYLYNKAVWISQTNEDRKRLFTKDYPFIDNQKMHLLANYPPKSWYNAISKKDFTSKEVIIKTIYIGSLSLKDTFIKEYCDWVIEQNGNVTFDIYAYNLHLDTIDFLSSLKVSFIKFYETGVEYHEIPKLLMKYDVGMILYKAQSENYKYNAPNKLFEYLACGLQVWYPSTMLGIKPYESGQVIELDFSKLDCLSVKTKLDESAMSDVNYYAENELVVLIKELER